MRSDSGTLVVIDCGTGAHGLGQSLVAEVIQPLRGHLLISHTHWDHIQGIPFFAPLFASGNEWDIYAPHSLRESIRDTLAGQMQYTYFPMTIEALGASITYHDLVEGMFEVGDITVRSRYLNHPALTLGYRLDADGVSIVYACDHEPFSRKSSTDRIEVGEQDRQHAEFMRGADLVIHDAQYIALEYAEKIGWGHSPAEYAIELCHAAEVKQLALTHHDPTRDDESLDQIVHAMRARLKLTNKPLHVFAAAEGETIKLKSRADRETTKGTKEFSAVTPIAPVLSESLIFLGATDAQTAEVIKGAAEAEDVRLISATRTQNAIQTIEAEPPSLVIVDEQSVGGDALAVCRRVKALGTRVTPQAPIVVVADRENTASALADFATDWMLRPFSQPYARTRIRAWILRTTCRWIRAQWPENEEARLAALVKLKILDTEPEERFDRIARIASEAFNVPIALVSLIDRDRQWFKACIGLNVKETPRDMAFCAHAILENRVLIVPDTFLDTRFADNPLVTGEPRIRFYAGCPLRLPDGYLIGTLCLIDSRPRHLDGGKINLLRDLGKLVETELLRGLK
ncbi:MBL fold metallo-hydrolase [Candidatus Nitrospira neomarina]|uniref:MBL fold metallo-hydrolase n=1 Tax=Candidatus Nitrospira neomarina TaxID=3020899 RepID=A0AA96GIQ4_9BACT|nr:GAF domain-containing protein [Candidatus Nitrospira neomarina]WNM60920.1 MBL fold metallo-hydrolase [Candidatus Nitrospira neomarina]